MHDAMTDCFAVFSRHQTGAAAPPDLPLRVRPPEGGEKTWGGPAFSHERAQGGRISGAGDALKPAAGQARDLALQFEFEQASS